MSNNFTSNNFISTAASANGYLSELWIRLWFEIIEPDIVIFGLIANALVIIVMLRQGVAVGTSPKIYYTSIAISDFFNLINNWVLYTLINDSMYEFSM